MLVRKARLFTGMLTTILPAYYGFQHTCDTRHDGLMLSWIQNTIAPSADGLFTASNLQLIFPAVCESIVLQSRTCSSNNFHVQAS